MDTTINERFNQLIEALRMNPSAFAKSINKSYTAIENTLKGRTRPGFDLLEAVSLTYPNVDTDWLISGKGEMFRLSTKPADGGAFGESIIGEMSKNLDSLKQVFEDELKAKNSQLAAKDQQILAKDTQIDRLTRMLENAMGKPEDTPEQGRVIPLWSVLKAAV